MTIEYRFCLTPRLIALAIFSGVALMVLLFALGYLIGQQMLPKLPSGAAGRAADAAQRRAVQKFDKTGAALLAPIAAPANALQKVAP
jgi:hypothetical protein